jgi:hypothetical protein
MRNRFWSLLLGLVLAALLPCFVAAAAEATEEEPVSKFDMSKGGPT